MPGWRCQIRERHGDGGSDLLDGASGRVALQEGAAVGAQTDGEAALVLVVVRRTEREPAVTGPLHAAESLEDGGLHGAHAGHSCTGTLGVPSQNTSTTCEMPEGLLPTT